jgi:3-hydroxyacyl-CoA dehydrogenase/enoyl-CoA hydratase/3-hydroxybutyryl-CoA epimerase
MIDISGLPMPEKVPAPGSCVRIERPEAGLARIVLDPPHREHTVIDVPLLRDIDLALDELSHDGGLRGLVITGRRPTHFAYGADLDALESIRSADLVARLVRAGHQVFGRIAALDRLRTVAAVGGPVLGGALELALACRFIVAADHPSTRLGLPEVKLGILPAWGGTHRLPRRIGIVRALEAILKGRSYTAAEARRIGIVDRVTPSEFLLRVADAVAMGRDETAKTPRRLKLTDRLVGLVPPISRAIENRAQKQVFVETRGHYPAPLAVVSMLPHALRTSDAAAAEKEAAAGAHLATGPVAKNLIRIFRASEAAKKLAVGPGGERPAPITRGAVIGGGVMGGRIASLLAQNGIAARLCDVALEPLVRAELEHRREVMRKLGRRQLARHEADAAIDRFEFAQGMSGLSRAEIVIEAVVEKLEVKRTVFAEIARAVSPDALLATNTSSLSVDAIGAEIPHPERFLGLHFFNPVAKMPLVEIVRGTRTADANVRRAAALALRLGKTPVIVRDVAGFLVNRILGPYLDEALRSFEAGFDAARLERAFEDFGMPMGPLRLLDEVGFDVATHAARSLFSAYGERMRPTIVLDAFVKEGRLGKKSGQGFYHHSRSEKEKPTLSLDLARFQTGSYARSFAAEEVLERCLFAMLNEAARCLEEEVVAGPIELDLATVFGTGFAPFRGGLLRWADEYGLSRAAGRMRMIASAEDVAARAGGPARFLPAASIERAIGEKRGFHS